MGNNDYNNIPRPSTRDELYATNLGGGIKFLSNGHPITLLGDSIDNTDERSIPQGANLIWQKMKRHVEINGFRRPLPN